MNACTRIPVKIRHHHLDDLIIFIQYLVPLLGAVPGLFKADIDAAFRRIPIFPGHRWAAAVMYASGGLVSSMCVEWPWLRGVLLVVGVHLDPLRMSLWREKLSVCLGNGRQGALLSCTRYSASEHISLR